MQKICLILGCFGRNDDGFIGCNSVENTIFVLDPSYPFYHDMMDFFDQNRLFDRSLLDYNAVRHLFFNVQDRFGYVNKNIWTEKQFRLIEKFSIQHQDCGLYLKLKLNE